MSGRDGPIAKLVGRGGSTGAVGAAIKPAIDLCAMADHSAAAVLTYRRHRLDRTFEAVKDMPCSGSAHLECLVIVVPAYLARGHAGLLLPGGHERAPPRSASPADRWRTAAGRLDREGAPESRRARRGSRGPYGRAGREALPAGSPLRARAAGARSNCAALPRER